MFLSQACEREDESVPLRKQKKRRKERTHGNRNHSIQPMTRRGRLDRIGNQVPTLEGVTHAEGAHRDPVRNTDGTELVACDAGFGEGGFDAVAKLEDVHVAAARGEGRERRVNR
jgi:hypothetical protein